MLSSEGAGNKIIATIEKGICPKIIPARATALSECFLTMPFQVAWSSAANKTTENTNVSIKSINSLYRKYLDILLYLSLLK